MPTPKYSPLASPEQNTPPRLPRAPPNTKLTRPERCGRHELDPVGCGGAGGLCGGNLLRRGGRAAHVQVGPRRPQPAVGVVIVDGGRQKTRGRRLVASEVGGVDLDAQDVARQSQPNQRPVVPGRPPPPGLPPVHHLALRAKRLGVPERLRRLQQVGADGEPLVRREENARAQPSVGQVGQPAEARRQPPRQAGHRRRREEWISSARPTNGGQAKFGSRPKPGSVQRHTMVAASDAGLSAGSARQSSQQVLTSLNTMLRQPLSSVGGGAGGAAGGAAPSEAADRRAAAQQQAEKAALDDFLLMHARRYDFSSGDGAADAFGTTFALLVNERFLSAPNWLRMGTADFRLRVLQCMRVLMRDGAHRRAFGRTSGAVARLCDLCVDLTTEHFEPPTLDGYTSEMLVETLSILKRFAHISAPAAAHPVHAPAHNSADTSAEVSAPASAHTSAHASADASVVSSGRPSACASVMGSPASPTGARRPLFDIDGLAHPPAGPPVVSATGAPPPSVSAADRPAGPLPSRTASPAMGRAGTAAPPITKSGEGNAAAFGGGACGEEALGEGATEPWRLHGALVALLSTREALVLQCVLVAMYQFVQVQIGKGDGGVD